MEARCSTALGDLRGELRVASPPESIRIASTSSALREKGGGGAFFVLGRQFYVGRVGRGQGMGGAWERMARETEGEEQRAVSTSRSR